MVPDTAPGGMHSFATIPYQIENLMMTLGKPCGGKLRLMKPDTIPAFEDHKRNGPPPTNTTEHINTVITTYRPAFGPARAETSKTEEALDQKCYPTSVTALNEEYEDDICQSVQRI
jgi:hypothetical protein